MRNQLCCTLGYVNNQKPRVKQVELRSIQWEGLTCYALLDRVLDMVPLHDFSNYSARTDTSPLSSSSKLSIDFANFPS